MSAFSGASDISRVIGRADDSQMIGDDAASRPNPGWMYTTRWGISDHSRLDEFNAWYDDVHLPRLLAVPGFQWATRYLLRDDPAGAHFLTTYGISGPDVLQSAPYLSLPGWEHWRPLVIDWHRAVFRREEELGDRGRTAK